MEPTGLTSMLVRNVVIVEASGTYATDDMRRAVVNALDACSTPPRALMIDLTHSASISARTAAEVSTMAEFLATRAPQYGGCLVMIASDVLAYGLMRMGTALAEIRGVDAHAVRTRDEAWTIIAPEG